MTDLDHYLAQPERLAAISEIARRIEADEISYLYCQFISVTGRVVGKGVPAKHWRSIAEEGYQLVYGATENLFTDRRGQYIGYGAEARELVAMPDVETFQVLPWDPRVARVFCTLFRGREEDVEPGSYLTSDCRGNLRRLHQEFTVETGIELRLGCEPEMMWLRLNPDGSPALAGIAQRANQGNRVRLTWVCPLMNHSSAEVQLISRRAR